MSQVLEAGTRPARVFAPVLLVAGALLLVAAVVSGLSVLGQHATVLAEGPAGQPLRLSSAATTGSMTVLAATRDGAATTVEDRCRVSSGRSVVSGAYGTGATTRDGRTYRPFAKVAHGWTDDRTLTCSGPHLERVLVVQDHRTPRILLSMLLAVAGLGGLVLGLVGVASRRRRGGDARTTAGAA